jgi:hypothetical protein
VLAAGLKLYRDNFGFFTRREGLIENISVF